MLSQYDSSEGPLLRPIKRKARNQTRYTRNFIAPSESTSISGLSMETQLVSLPGLALVYLIPRHRENAKSQPIKLFNC